MSLNQLLIILNGEDKRVINVNANKIILAKKDLKNISHAYTLLQTNFESLEDLIKAVSIIKNQFSKIDEIVIIYRDIDLNMISYQYDYNYIKQNYFVLTNIIYFQSLTLRYNLNLFLLSNQDFLISFWDS